MRRSLPFLLCLLLSIIPQLVLAANFDRVQFSGFASFVAAKSLKKNHLYGDATSSIPHATELRDYSKLGLRVSVDLYDKLSFTTQMLADGRDDFKPEFDWVFLSYAITPDLVVHVGKYVTSYFMYSDYSDISYAYQWVEAPNAVYGTNINKTLEGTKLVWTSSLSPNWSSELSLMAGKDKTNLDKVGVSGASFKMRSAFGIAWQVEHDWLTLRASHMATRSSADIANTRLDVRYNLKETPYENSDVFEHPGLKNILDWKSSPGHFSSLGASTHFQKFFTVAEITHTNLKNTIAIGKQSAGYFTIGTYLPKQVTLALTVYKKRNKYNSNVSKAIERAVAASNDANAAQIGHFLTSMLNNIQNRNREGFTLSSRWDFHSNAALKAEYMYEWQTDYPKDFSFSGQIKKRHTHPQALRLGVDLAF